VQGTGTVKRRGAPVLLGSSLHGHGEEDKAEMTEELFHTLLAKLLIKAEKISEEKECGEQYIVRKKAKNLKICSKMIL